MENIIDLLNKILALMVKENASDLYIKADMPPTLKINEEFVPIEMEKFSPEFAELLAFQIMSPAQKENFMNNPEANFMYTIAKSGRFRVNVYRQRGTIALVMRRIREDIQDIDSLQLPSVLKKMALYKRGLILVTGPTGSGKSTTLAAIIDYRNQNSFGHIITIEDPIEFIHYDKKSLISQREVGIDTISFNNALENALRQAPNVLLVGEMRDVASVNAAVHFAETGHLVLSTLHSPDVPQTIERVLQFFPSEVHEQTRMQLSLSLKGVVSQRLIQKKDGSGMIPAVEIMAVNARMQDLIANGELKQIKRELDQFQPDGMQTFDYALLELYKSELITEEEAIKSSDVPNDMRLKIKTLPNYIKSSVREEYAKSLQDPKRMMGED